MSRTAVVLFNLGGPDSLKAVRPFLFNLFNDPAIIPLPCPLRYLLARLISTSRAAKARGIYRKLGGRSPILPQTIAQAEALESRLSRSGDYKVFVSMRYWHPMSGIVTKKVKAYDPDHIILLPLYPHYSTTTTASSFQDWQQSCHREGLEKPTTAICCYPTDRHFIAAHARLIKAMYWKAAETQRPRLLFSAHGLPEKVIAKGDPYQMQVEKTAEAIVQLLAIDDLDYRVCYQSRVGRLQWIRPYTEDEIVQAGKERKPVLVVPVAFVSEHSETLVELDMDYRKLAEGHQVPAYWRVPALCADPLFIDALAELCLTADASKAVCPAGGKRLCADDCRQCPCAAG